jgi:acyl-coenzyme A thioesterase PaaI-like protein
MNPGRASDSRLKPLRPTGPELIEDLQRTLDLQPSSQFIGAVIRHFRHGVAELHFPLRIEFLQQRGVPHEGVISYAASLAMMVAAEGVLGRAVRISRFKINFIREIQGDGLVARARVISTGAFEAEFSCDIYVQKNEFREPHPANKLCSVAVGTVACLESSNSDSLPYLKAD